MRRGAAAPGTTSAAGRASAGVVPASLAILAGLTIPACLTILAAGPAAAQSPDQYRHPIDLFESMRSDTVTANLFNHFAPQPDLRLVGVAPDPDVDVFLDATDLACADLDQDGWTDVVLGGSLGDGDPPSRVLWGRPDGRFDADRPPGLPALMPRVTRADMDGDGRTDLVAIVATGGRRRSRHGFQDPLRFPRCDVVVLINQGGRRFAVRERHALNATDLLVRDLDGDGWLDVLVASAEPHGAVFRESVLLRGGPDGLVVVRRWPTPQPDWGHAMFLLLPVGPQQHLAPVLAKRTVIDPWPWPLALRGPATGADGWAWERSPIRLDGATDSAALADVGGDGQVDIFLGVTDYVGGRNRLLLATGTGGWRDVGRQAGLWAGYNYTRCGAWGDVDNDGRPDLWQNRERGGGRPSPGQLFWSRDDTTLVNATRALSRPALPSSKRGAWLDSDRDGRLDLLVAMHSPFPDVVPFAECRPLLYRNASPAGDWLQLRLVGRPPNTDAIGGQLTVWSGGARHWRHVDDGSGSGGASPPLVHHVGMGTASAADSVVVRWPDGTREVWRDLTAGRRYALRQGRATAEVLEKPGE